MTVRTNQWKVFAYECIIQLADTGKEFTADNIVFLCGYPDTKHKPNGVNGMIGGLFSQARRAGYIVKCGYRASTSKTRKGGALSVWIGNGTPFSFPIEAERKQLARLRGINDNTEMLSFSAETEHMRTVANV